MIQFAALAPLAIKVGAPIIGSLLKSLIPGKAGKVVEEIAGKLGVSPTEEAIVEKYEAEPELVSQIIQTVETDYAEIAKAAADATKSYHGVLATDQTAKSWITRHWRPLNGFMFGIEVGFIIVTACIAILQQIPINSELLPLISLVGTALTVHAGVVGVYTWKRSDEKKAGVA